MVFPWFFYGSLVALIIPLGTGLQLVIYGLAIALLLLIFVIPSPLIDPKGEGHHAEHIKQGRQMVPLGVLKKTRKSPAKPWLT